MSGEHSLWSPSGAKRWACHGAMAACVGIPNTAGKAAALGTAKHTLGFNILTSPYPTRGATSAVGTEFEADGFKFVVDDEFADHVDMYVNGVNLLRGDKSFEVKVDTSRVLGIPGQSGTIDVCVEDYENLQLYIGDAKFGYHRVPAKGNRQLIIYAAARLDDIDPDRMIFTSVKLGIFQPQAGDLPDEYVYTRDELDYEMIAIRADAQAGNALIGAPHEVIEAAKIPSPGACEWCPIREMCDARRNAIGNSFPIMPEQIQRMGENYNVDDELVKLALDLERIDEIEKWCRDRRAYALQRALSGANIPGWRMVVGRKGSRKFEDAYIAELAMREDLGDDVYDKPSLISPTEAERRYKRLKKAEAFKSLSALISQADGAPSLARVSDGGTPVAVGAEFGIVEVAT